MDTQTTNPNNIKKPDDIVAHTCDGCGDTFVLRTHPNHPVDDEMLCPSCSDVVKNSGELNMSPENKNDEGIEFVDYGPEDEDDNEDEFGNARDDGDDDDVFEDADFDGEGYDDEDYDSEEEFDEFGNPIDFIDDINYDPEDD